MIRGVAVSIVVIPGFISSPAMAQQTCEEMLKLPPGFCASHSDQLVEFESLLRSAQQQLQDGLKNALFSPSLTGHYSFSLTELQPLSEQGDDRASFALGIMYLDGLGVQKNPVLGATLVRQAAKNYFFHEAQYVTGLLYERGVGVTEDKLTALSWFQKSADIGNAKAQVRMGYAYLLGEGVPENAVASFDWFRKAAVQGNSVAQFQLWRFNSEGIGASRRLEDKREAQEWLTSSAKAGFAISQSVLSASYEAGTNGFTQDFVAAYKWIELIDSMAEPTACPVMDHPTMDHEAALAGCLYIKATAKFRRDAMSKSMTYGQIVDAQAMANRCLASKFKDCD